MLPGKRCVFYAQCGQEPAPGGSAALQNPYRPAGRRFRPLFLIKAPFQTGAQIRRKLPGTGGVFHQNRLGPAVGIFQKKAGVVQKRKTERAPRLQRNTKLPDFRREGGAAAFAPILKDEDFSCLKPAAYAVDEKNTALRREKLEEALSREIRAGVTILVKASRSMAFEKIVDYLTAQTQK